MNIFGKATNAVKAVASKAGVAVKNASPEILVGLGIVGVIAATVIACKKTYIVEDVIDEIESEKEHLEDMVQSIEQTDPERTKYTKRDEAIDRTRLVVRNIARLAKHYAVPIGIMAVSIASILCGFGILKGRYVSMTAAYEGLKHILTDYRGRVKNKLGEEEEKKLFYNVEYSGKSFEYVDDNGETKKVKSYESTGDVLEMGHGFAQIYGAKSYYMDESDTFRYIQNIINAAQVRCNAGCVVTLNELFEALPLDRTKEGLNHGWGPKEEIKVEIIPIHYTDENMKDQYVFLIDPINAHSIERFFSSSRAKKSYIPNNFRVATWEEINAC